MAWDLDPALHWEVDGDLSKELRKACPMGSLSPVTNKGGSMLSLVSGSTFANFVAGDGQGR